MSNFFWTHGLISESSLASRHDLKIQWEKHWEEHWNKNNQEKVVCHFLSQREFLCPSPNLPVQISLAWQKKHKTTTTFFSVHGSISNSGKQTLCTMHHDECLGSWVQLPMFTVLLESFFYQIITQWFEHLPIYIESTILSWRKLTSSRSFTDSEIASLRFDALGLHKNR